MSKLSIETPMMSFQNLYDHCLRLEHMIKRMAEELNFNLNNDMLSFERALDNLNTTTAAPVAESDANAQVAVQDASATGNPPATDSGDASSVAGS